MDGWGRFIRFKLECAEHWVCLFMQNSSVTHKPIISCHIQKHQCSFFKLPPGLQPPPVFVWTEDAVPAKSELCLVLCDGFYVKEGYMSAQLHFIWRAKAEPWVTMSWCMYWLICTRFYKLPKQTFYRDDDGKHQLLWVLYCVLTRNLTPVSLKEILVSQNLGLSFVGLTVMPHGNNNIPTTQIVYCWNLETRQHC